MSTPIGRQVVVVGAGIGGLTAAAALADHFERVVVLERDALAREAAHRAGTPQAKHVHALLAGGQHALGDLLPGFEQDLARAGAVPLRVGLDVRVERPGYDPFPQRDLGWLGYSMSRPLIELTVRERVEQRANITMRPRCRAQDLVVTPDGAAVTAVRCQTADGRSETLPADLVVDASGRGALTLIDTCISNVLSPGKKEWGGVEEGPQEVGAALEALHVARRNVRQVSGVRRGEVRQGIAFETGPEELDRIELGGVRGQEGDVPVPVL